jgi:hypothetical protein
MGQVGGVGAEGDFKLPREHVHLGMNVSREASHDNCMVFMCHRDSTDCNVTISNGFDFENATAFGNLIHRTIHCFKQQEYLALNVSEGREEKVRIGNKRRSRRR